MIESNRPPVPVADVLEDPGLVRRLVERHAPYEPIQRYVASAEEQRLLSQNDRVDPSRGAREAEPVFVAPVFRGDWAYDEPLVDGVEPILHNEHFVAAARKIFGGAVVVPQIVYVNLTLPIPDYDVGHTDVPAFRGVDRTRYPVWLLIAMGRSGLFERWRVPIATAVSWWFEGEGGSFTYWPEGPDRPSRTVPPTPNTAVVGDNDFMFHRADGVGGEGVGWLRGLSLDSRLEFLGGDGWAVREGDREIARFGWREVRVSVSWKAQVFRDAEEQALYRSHADDLTLDPVVDALLADLAEHGRELPRPGDPLTDDAFIAAVGETYKRTPTVQPGRP
jgi:hypothetical protein